MAERKLDEEENFADDDWGWPDTEEAARRAWEEAELKRIKAETIRDMFPGLRVVCFLSFSAGHQRRRRYPREVCLVVDGNGMPASCYRGANCHPGQRK